MKLPDQRRILREDLKTKETWVSALIDPLNSFMNTVYIALNKNLTFSENIRCMVKEVTLVTSSAYPGMEPIRFQSTLGIKATGLVIVQALKSSDYTPVTSPVYAAWFDDSGTIKITSVSGLDTSETYLLRFLVF